VWLDKVCNLICSDGYFSPIVSMLEGTVPDLTELTAEEGKRWKKALSWCKHFMLEDGGLLHRRLESRSMVASRLCIP
jgi:hypothetical protein